MPEFTISSLFLERLVLLSRILFVCYNLLIYCSFVSSSPASSLPSNLPRDVVRYPMFVGPRAELSCIEALEFLFLCVFLASYG